MVQDFVLLGRDAAVLGIGVKLFEIVSCLQLQKSIDVRELNLYTFVDEGMTFHEIPGTSYPLNWYRILGKRDP